MQYAKTAVRGMELTAGQTCLEMRTKKKKPKAFQLRCKLQFFLGKGRKISYLFLLSFYSPKIKKKGESGDSGEG